MSTPYDNQDMTGWDLSDRKDMSGLFIEGLCLSQESPNSKVLPANLIGTTFSYCNLDNVLIPAGNIVQNCSTRLFKVQNDGEDWIVDSGVHKPLVPVNSNVFIQLGLSIDPADIPAQPLDKSVVMLKIEQLSRQRESVIDQAAQAFDNQSIVKVPGEASPLDAAAVQSQEII